jgi:hypothetical protein
MLGMCFYLGAVAEQKRREKAEKAQGPEGAPLVRRDTQGEARAAPAEEKEC